MKTIFEILITRDGYTNTQALNLIKSAKKDYEERVNYIDDRNVCDVCLDHFGLGEEFIEDLIFKTNTFKELTDERCDELKRLYFKKPDINLVTYELMKVNSGGTQLTNTTKYFFRELMCKTKLYASRWSVEDAMNNNDIIRYLMGNAEKNKIVFPGDDLSNLATSFRLSVGGMC